MKFKTSEKICKKTIKNKSDVWKSKYQTGLNLYELNFEGKKYITSIQVVIFKGKKKFQKFKYSEIKTLMYSSWKKHLEYIYITENETKQKLKKGKFDIIKVVSEIV